MRHASGLAVKPNKTPKKQGDSSTDTGHDAASPTEGGARFGNDALFGKEREIDFGYRAVHVTALTSKDIIKAHYADNFQFSYWNGCSTGGSIISPAKRDMIGRIVYNGNGGNFAGCDAKDGLVDGQIRNPLTCDFNPAVHVPACDGTNAAECLTAAELSALQEVYAGKPPFTPRLPFGSENTPGGWMSWIVPNSGVPQLHPVMVDAFQWLMFDPDRQGQAPQQLIGSKTGSTRPHCAYPQEAVYNGTGDQNLAASYTCKLPL